MCCGALWCAVLCSGLLQCVISCGVLHSAGGGGGGSVLWPHDVRCGVLCCHVVWSGSCGVVGCHVVWCGDVGYRAIALDFWLVEWCVGRLAGWVVWQLGVFARCSAGWGML